MCWPEQVHTATHPAASLNKQDAPPLPGHSAPASDAEELFATLDAEGGWDTLEALRRIWVPHPLRFSRVRVLTFHFPFS